MLVQSSSTSSPHHHRHRHTPTIPTTMFSVLMGRRSSLLSHYYSSIPTCSKMLIYCTILTLFLASSSSRSQVNGATLSHSSPRGSSSRMNSRFLRTFPQSLEYYGNYGRTDTMNEIPTHQLVNGNSPVFYIRLPPAPYILVPGLGYVSPHPYNSPMAMGMPGPVMVSQSNQNQLNSDLSSEQSQKSVISLPLKFLSNGRPAQIESPKKPAKLSESKGSELISGGKYSFNGRPTAVFVVRSPA